MIERWGMTNSEKLGILSRIKGTTDYHRFKGCDIVIEAVKSYNQGRLAIRSGCKY